MYKFGRTSLERLASCDIRLIEIMERAIETSPFDFTIVSGHRGEEEQNGLVADGKSQLKYPYSKHNAYPSKAVDIAPYVDGKLVWDDDELWTDMAIHIFETARQCGVKLEWGGNWTSFVDKPHWEIVE